MREELDATGLLCPLPVLKARKRLMGLAPGDLLVLQTDDPAAVVDVPHFCNEAGHRLRGSRESQGVTTWEIEKAG